MPEPETTTCEVCDHEAERIVWGSGHTRADYICSSCRAGGAITTTGKRVGPVFEGATPGAASIHRRRAQA